MRLEMQGLRGDLVLPSSRGFRQHLQQHANIAVKIVEIQ
jgi:hypothetical protein